MLSEGHVVHMFETGDLEELTALGVGMFFLLLNRLLIEWTPTHPKPPIWNSWHDCFLVHFRRFGSSLNTHIGSSDIRQFRVHSESFPRLGNPHTI